MLSIYCNRYLIVQLKNKIKLMNRIYIWKSLISNTFVSETNISWSILSGSLIAPTYLIIIYSFYYVSKMFYFYFMINHFIWTYKVVVLESQIKNTRKAMQNSNVATFLEDFRVKIKNKNNKIMIADCEFSRPMKVLMQHVSTWK